MNLSSPGGSTLVMYFRFVCFKLNAIRFIDLVPESKQTISEPDPDL